MDVKALAIPDVKLIAPRRIEDDRGFFSETYRKEDLAAAGIDDEFVQDKARPRSGSMLQWNCRLTIGCSFGCQSASRTDFAHSHPKPR